MRLLLAAAGSALVAGWASAVQAPGLTAETNAVTEASSVAAIEPPAARAADPGANGSIEPAQPLLLLGGLAAVCLVVRRRSRDDR